MAKITKPAKLLTPASDLPRFISVSDVKHRYGWGRTTTYYLLSENKITAFRMGTRKLLISVESCENYINSLKPAVIKMNRPPPPPRTGRPVGRPRKYPLISTTT
jgi:hypothetical protein